MFVRFLFLTGLAIAILYFTLRKKKFFGYSGYTIFQGSTEDILKINMMNSKSFNDLFNDADNGNEVAQYLLGLAFFFGKDHPKSKDFPKDWNSAKHYFSLSSSLGFTPALDMLQCMYAAEQKAFLSFVYSNLIELLGHYEFVAANHKVRNKIVEQNHESIIDEIKRIVDKKHEIILKNKKGLRKATDKKKFILTMDKITTGDFIFDENYWKNII